MKLTWYDGGLLPPKPVELGEDEQLNKGGGVLLVGSKGKLLHDTYGLKPRLLPASLHAVVGKPPQKLPRIPNEDHEMNWVDAAKGKARRRRARSNTPRSSTEVMLLGVVALRAGRRSTTTAPPCASPTSPPPTNSSNATRAPAGNVTQSSASHRLSARLCWLFSTHRNACRSNLKPHAFCTLQIGDNLEQIAGLRISARAQHSHQAL